MKLSQSKQQNKEKDTSITFKILPLDYRFQSPVVSDGIVHYYFKSIEEENQERISKEKQYREKCEINKQNREEIKTLTKHIKDQEKLLKKQTKEINQLKDYFHQLQTTLDPIEPENISITIPLKHFITDEPFIFSHNNYQFAIQVDSSIENGIKMKYEGYGSEKYGVKRDLIVSVFLDFENGKYQRKNDDLIEIISFEKQYQGMIVAMTIELPDGSKQKADIILEDQLPITFAGKGLKKSDGSKGDYILKIQLV